MTATLAHLAALQLIQTIADGSTTANSLPHIAKIAEAALGGMAPADISPTAGLLREVAACTHSDPNRNRSGAGRWLTVNVPRELWDRIGAALCPAAVAGQPESCRSTAEAQEVGHG